LLLAQRQLFLVRLEDKIGLIPVYRRHLSCD
jgi:hypothetical protein